MTTLARFLARLDRHTKRVPLQELTAMLRDLEVSPDDVEKVAFFSDQGYQRNRLHEGPGYEALVLCWKSGQHSPIHDHTGSSCGVLVIQGTMTETVFRRGRDGRLIAARSHELHQGGICGSQDSDIHQVSNLSETPLITLHIYTPPLRRMNTYSLTEPMVREYRMPLQAYSYGAGI